MSQKKKRRKAKSRQSGRVTNIMATVLLVLVIIICIPITVPRMFGYQVYHVISGSMEPEIPTKSLVYVKEIDPAELKKDDIIAFYSSVDEGAITTHRVVENHSVSEELITKGDANAENDPLPVLYENVLGKLVVHIPLMGEFMAMVATTIGKAVIAGIIGLAVILFFWG